MTILLEAVTLGVGEDIEGRFPMKLPHNQPTDDRPLRDRDPAEEAISHHDDANFAETPTARKAIRQFQLLVGFLTILMLGILALWIVPLLTIDNSLESPEPTQEVID